MIHVTLYEGARSPAPIRRDDFADFSELCDSLEDLVDTEFPDKLHMWAWAPHRLADIDRRTDAEIRRSKGGARADGPYRHTANVIELTALVVDVDRCTIDPLLDAVASLGSEALVYTSPSDNPHGPADARRVRVVLPVDAPILPADSRHTRLALAERLGLAPGSGVEGAVDAAKIFFAGRITGSPRRDVWRFR